MEFISAGLSGILTQNTSQEKVTSCRQFVLQNNIRRIIILSRYRCAIRVAFEGSEKWVQNFYKEISFVLSTCIREYNIKIYKKWTVKM